MAFRKIDFSIYSTETGVFQKPAGTLGAHGFIVREKFPDGGLTVEGIDSHGKPVNKVTLKPGQVAGYDKGEIWAIRTPNEYRCPLRRLLAEFGVSQAALSRETPDVVRDITWGSTPEGSCADTRSGVDFVALGGNTEYGKSSGYTAAIEFDFVKLINVTNRPKRVFRVRVKPGLSPDEFNKVLDWLRVEIPRIK